MSQTAKSYNTNGVAGGWNVTIPNNAINISFYMRGGRGGSGGADAGASGGGTGSATWGSYVVKSQYNYNSFSGSGSNASQGFNGTNNQGGAPGGSPGGGWNSGGGGGPARPKPYSGGGGGGGGSSGYSSVTGGTLIVHGGSGGGGGASDNRPGNGGGNAGLPSAYGGSVPSSNGGGGGSSGGGDGGGGGGGGGGSNGGPGGGVGADNSTPAGGGSGGGTRYNSNVLQLVNSGYSNFMTGTFIAAWTEVEPFLSSFSASYPHNNNRYSVQLGFSYGDNTYATITDSLGNSYDVNGSTSLTINNLPQTTAPSNSPIGITYTLTVGHPTRSVSSQVSISITNDKTISNTSSFTTSWTDLEPGSPVEKDVISAIQGTDIATSITSSDSDVFFWTSSTGSWGGTRVIQPGDGIRIKFTPSPYSTDLSGVSPGDTFGNTNTRTIPITIGSSYAANWTATTKAPIIKEVFDFAGETGDYPNPDIDFDPSTPDVYQLSNQIVVNDIQIPMEIKCDDSNLQVKINSNPWQDIGEIPENGI